jgi:hypothetical protein
LSQKTNIFPESGLRKRFCASELDFPHKITPIEGIFRKKFLVPKSTKITKIAIFWGTLQKFVQTTRQNYF